MTLGAARPRDLRLRAPERLEAVLELRELRHRDRQALRVQGEGVRPDVDQRRVVAVERPGAEGRIDANSWRERRLRLSPSG